MAGISDTECGNGRMAFRPLSGVFSTVKCDLSLLLKFAELEMVGPFLIIERERERCIVLST